MRRPDNYEGLQMRILGILSHETLEIWNLQNEISDGHKLKMVSQSDRHYTRTFVSNGAFRPLKWRVDKIRHKSFRHVGGRLGLDVEAHRIQIYHVDSFCFVFKNWPTYVWTECRWGGGGGGVRWSPRWAPRSWTRAPPVPPPSRSSARGRGHRRYAGPRAWCPPWTPTDLPPLICIPFKHTWAQKLNRKIDWPGGGKPRYANESQGCAWTSYTLQNVTLLHRWTQARCVCAILGSSIRILQTHRNGPCMLGWFTWGSIGVHCGPHRTPVGHGSTSVGPTVDSHGPPHLNPVKHTWTKRKKQIHTLRTNVMSSIRKLDCFNELSV